MIIYQIGNFWNFDSFTNFDNFLIFEIEQIQKLDYFITWQSRNLPLEYEIKVEELKRRN